MKRYFFMIVVLLVASVSCGLYGFEKGGTGEQECSYLEDTARKMVLKPANMNNKNIVSVYMQQIMPSLDTPYYLIAIEWRDGSFEKLLHDDKKYAKYKFYIDEANNTCSSECKALSLSIRGGQVVITRNRVNEMNGFEMDFCNMFADFGLDKIIFDIKGRLPATNGNDAASGVSDWGEINVARKGRTSSKFDVERDRDKVESYIAMGESSKALKYLDNLFKDGYPTDPDELFAYAGMAQSLEVAFRKEAGAKAFTMDPASMVGSMAASSNQQSAGVMLRVLMYLAASKGHSLAAQFLQAQMAIDQGNNAYYNQLNSIMGNGGGSGSSSNGEGKSKSTCSLCKGKGWISGSKTPTYGNTGRHYCDECDEFVNASHSHDQCPSCGGRGYR